MKLLEIQQELKAPKNQHNFFGKYNYRSCEDILEAVKPLLNGCTLVLTDEIKTTGAYTYVESQAIFIDGDTTTIVKAQAGIQDRKGMDLAQSFGSSSSYARKYALNGLFLIDDTKDADTKEQVNETDKIKVAIDEMINCKNENQLKDVWAKYKRFQTEKEFIDTKEEMKTSFKLK